MEIWKLAILFFSAFIGGYAVFLVKGNKIETLKLILSFSGAYLFAITVLHLIPEAYSQAGTHVGVFVLIGFVFQIVLEQFSKGVEHGHLDTHDLESKIFPVGIMFSLCIHAFLEGMPIVSDVKNELIFGIAIHHVPAAFALASILLRNKISKGMILVSIFLFALMCPLGYGLSWGLKTGNFGAVDAYFNEIMGVVIGIFLHISTTILFESSVNHKVKIKKMLAALLGFALALMSLFLH